MTERTPSIDGDLLDAVADELQERHRKRIEGEIQSAKEQAITSGQLADEVTGEDAEANPKTREAMKVLMRERGLPIVGDHRGNWIPVSDEPVEAKLSDLDSRIAGIEERKQLLSQNWTTWNRDDSEDQESVSIPQAVRERIGQETVSREAVIRDVADRVGKVQDRVADRIEDLEREGFLYETGEGVRLP